jgi:hypothetical protein
LLRAIAAASFESGDDEQKRRAEATWRAYGALVTDVAAKYGLPIEIAAQRLLDCPARRRSGVSKRVSTMLTPFGVAPRFN